jgi:hypothetical protein
MNTAQPLYLPTGWIRAGSAPERYEMGVAVPRSPAVIRSRTSDTAPDKFGTLMQSVSAGPFRGKRVRLRAELKTNDVHGAGTIWMRIDGGRRTLGFDNMERRKVEGVLTDTHDWAARQVVLDVPDSADSVHFGFFLRGSGQVLARKFEVAEVGEDVAVTSTGYLDAPTNLDFSELGEA